MWKIEGEAEQVERFCDSGHELHGGAHGKGKMPRLRPRRYI